MASLGNGEPPTGPRPEIRTDRADELIRQHGRDVPGHGRQPALGFSCRRAQRVRVGDGGHRPQHTHARERERLLAGTQKSWRRPIFPKGCPLSIFGAGELDCRVRDGNGYGLSADVTRISCVDCGSRLRLRHGFAAGRRSPSIRRVDDPSALTPGQLLKRSSPRPLVRLSFVRHRTSTCRLSNRWSTCGLTRLTRWGPSSRGELRT